MTLHPETYLNHAKKAKRKTKENVEDFATNSTVMFFIRVGYFMRGVLYGLIGVFACGLAFGWDKASASQTDIISFINGLPFGYVSVIVFLIGISCYALWGFLRAILLAKNVFERFGYIVSAIFYSSLIFPAYAILSHTSGNHRSTMSLQSLSALIIHLPFGQILLAAVGVGSIIAGGIQINRAIKAKKPHDFNFSTDKIRAPKVFMMVSRLGVGLRALLWAITGVFFLIAAYFADPNQTKGTNEVFNRLNELPFGFLFVAILGTGLILFGVYSISMSFWAIVPKDYN